MGCCVIGGLPRGFGMTRSNLEPEPYIPKTFQLGMFPCFPTGGYYSPSSIRGERPEKLETLDPKPQAATEPFAEKSFAPKP